MNAKLANRDFQISVVDILYPCQIVQIIRVDDFCQSDNKSHSSVLIKYEVLYMRLERSTFRLSTTSNSV